jgi:1,4-alpha-glucan branching enzyme
MLTTKAKNLQNSEREAPASDSKRFTVEVEFVLEHAGAEQVYICGDFNGWQPASLRMIGKPEAGLWEKRLPLQPGRYEYKFLVDGRWVHDPDAPENVPNVYGSLNSVVDVGPKSTPVL